MESNVWVEYKGERLTLSQMARKYGIEERVFSMRILRGWDVERALFAPIQKKKTPIDPKKIASPEQQAYALSLMEQAIKKRHTLTIVQVNHIIKALET